MTLRPSFAAMLRDRRGSGAAEFALVLPLLLVFLLGILDVSRAMYVMNMATKATQMGARFAVVTDVIPPQLVAADYTGVAGCGSAGTTVCVTGDQIVNTAALGTLSCTSTSCSCSPANSCPTGAAISAATFTGLVDHMKLYYPELKPTNVKVEFAGSGLGFAGDPTGMDVIPLVTVKLTGLTFAPVTLFSILSFTLPDFATTLSDESAVGQLSN